MNTIDIDTGGTFTDGVFRLDDRVVTVKVDTTPHDPVKCFMACIEEGARRLGKDESDLLEVTDVIRYATTAATNAIVQMKGAKIGLLVSAGAENHLYAREDGAEDGGDEDSQAPIGSFLDKSLVAGICEAVDDQGVVIASLDEESFRTAVEQLLDGGARLLVVALQRADLNPANELRARELFESMLPAFYLGRPFLLLSHQVSPSGTDAERLNSAVISGYLHRELVGYLYRCDAAVRRLGYRHPLLVVHSTGGLARVAKTKALNTYNSGPTAGVFGAARIARRYELQRVVTMDLGGTSTDVAFIEDGQQQLSFRAEIERVNVSVPMIDVVGLGGGGGSIVSLDGNQLQVGPESAGAVPGPACYDLGSSAPTVTDANAVLGLISPDNFLGGRRRMNIDSARQSVEETVARPLKTEIDDAALKIRSALAENLASSIRAEAEKRSFSLQDAVMFAYGGGGPLHAAEIAAATGVTAFYMFPESPVFSAAGSSTMDVQHFYESRIQTSEGENLSQVLKRVAAGLRDRAHRDMRGEGFDPATAKLEFVLDTPDGTQFIFDDMEWDTVVAEAACGGLLRLMATIETSGQDDAAPGITPPASQASGDEREIGWASGKSMTAVYSYPELAVGERIEGPALVETAETTCVIPQRWCAETDSYGALKVWQE
jgi:N-methylhydantoinase A/acetophenone carboxylase